MSDNSNNNENSDEEQSNRIVRCSPSGALIRAPPTLREYEHRNKRLQSVIRDLKLNQPQYQQTYTEHINTIQSASTLSDLANPDIINRHGFNNNLNGIKFKSNTTKQERDFTKLSTGIHNKSIEDVELAKQQLNISTLVEHRTLKKFSKMPMLQYLQNKYSNKSKSDVRKMYGKFIKRVSRSRESILRKPRLKNTLNPITKRAFEITEQEKANYGSAMELSNWRKKCNKINDKKEKEMNTRKLNTHIKRLKRYIKEYHTFEYVNQDTDELIFDRVKRRLASSQSRLQVQ